MPPFACSLPVYSCGCLSRCARRLHRLAPVPNPGGKRGARVSASAAPACRRDMDQRAWNAYGRAVGELLKTRALRGIQEKQPAAGRAGRRLYRSARCRGEPGQQEPSQAAHCPCAASPWSARDRSRLMSMMCLDTPALAVCRSYAQPVFVAQIVRQQIGICRSKPDTGCIAADGPNQLRCELHCWSLQGLLRAHTRGRSGAYPCSHCRIYDNVGHETQRDQSDRIVLKRFSWLARHMQSYAQTHCRAAPTRRTHP